MTKFTLKWLVFSSLLLIGAFQTCQFVSQAQELPSGLGGSGKPRQTVPGGPRFTQPREDMDQSPPRSGRSTRGTCRNSQLNPINLTGLVPENKIGRTVSDYPTFFFYLPPTKAESAEFILLDPTGNQIYKQTLTVTNLSGVIGVSIPANKNVPPLEVGKNYTWNFTVICEAEDRSADLLDIGTVRRVELSADIRSQLEKADPRRKTAIYAENGIWQDALSNLAAARRDRPSDTVLDSDWESLLDAVKLAKIAKQPIVQVQTDPKP
ncbi:DUF928 domain-containing protein [Microcoleus sp. A2-C5]|uniref:DUF928 domain-containing protein n=1 Tax=unclassified Microcoleus TaxID=2642155 RepID=UPI002FD0CDEE